MAAATPWSAAPAERAAVLRQAADLYEQNFGAIFALLAREAGKTLADAVAELREAVDFLRYYADGAMGLTALATGGVRVSGGWGTTENDWVRFADAWVAAYDKHKTRAAERVREVA